MFTTAGFELRSITVAGFFFIGSIILRFRLILLLLWGFVGSQGGPLGNFTVLGSNVYHCGFELRTFTVAGLFHQFDVDFTVSACTFTTAGFVGLPEQGGTPPVR